MFEFSLKMETSSRPRLPAVRNKEDVNICFSWAGELSTRARNRVIQVFVFRSFYMCALFIKHLSNFPSIYTASRIFIWIYRHYFIFRACVPLKPSMEMHVILLDQLCCGTYYFFLYTCLSGPYRCSAQQNENNHSPHCSLLRRGQQVEPLEYPTSWPLDFLLVQFGE